MKYISATICLLILFTTVLFPDPIIMEAEHGIDIKPNLEITHQKDASEGYTLHYGEGAGGVFGIHAHQDQEIELGTALYPFAVQKAGQYYVGARVFWMDKCGNQIRASLDNRINFKIFSRDNEKHTFKNWYWAISGPFPLNKGEHALKLIADEDGPYIDQVCVLSDKDARPEGIAKINWPSTFRAKSPKSVSISFSKPSQVITDTDGKFETTIWVRKLKPGKAFVSLSVKLPDDIMLITEKQDLGIGFTEQEILKPVKLNLKLTPESTRGEKTIGIEVKNKDGKVCTAGRTIFLKPYDWYILGVFPAWMHAEHPLAFGRNLDLNKPVKIGDHPQITWKRMGLDAFNPFQTIDFEHIYGPSVSKTAYLYTEIEVREEKRYLMLVNNDGATDIWIDGNLAYQEHWHHPAMGWLRQKYISLKKGKHTLLVRSEQNDKPDNDYQKNYWLFRLRIRDGRKKTSSIQGLECLKEK